MIDMIKMKVTNLERVTYLVLDEVWSPTKIEI
jgi:superfamily II DNA/RNA helicase